MKLSEFVPSLYGAPRLDTLRLQTLIRLRWFALVGVSAATFAALLMGFQGLAWMTLVTFMVLGLITNTVLAGVAESKGRVRFHRIYYLQIVLDIAALTGLLWASGGLANPFASLFLVHVVVAALIGTFSAVVFAGGLASFAAILLHIFDQAGLLAGRWAPPPYLQDSIRLGALLVNAVAIAAVVAMLSRRFQAKEARLSEARDDVRLREQVLDRVLSGLAAAVEVVEGDRVIWQNEAMGSIRRLDVGDGWICPGRLRGCNRAGRLEDDTCDSTSSSYPTSCLISVPVSGGTAVYRKYAWQVFVDKRIETVHLYVDETRRLAEDERLKMTERLASLGRMAQGLAHELNTPLSTVRTLNQDIAVVLRGEESLPAETRADVEESLTLSLKEIDRCARITRGLLNGRGLESSARPETQPLAPLVQDAVTLVSVGNRRSHRFATMLEESTAYVDPDALTQVLVNLLSNAVDAAPPDSMIEVTGLIRSNRMMLEIADRGEGLAPSIRERLFEPFATTKPVGKGTGLGLYMARLLLAEVGGTLELLEREGGGTIARVTLLREVEGAAEAV